MERESLFDAFCDYTSINGIRFLHSRHPKWFRIQSSVVLLAILSGFLFHASTFITRWTESRSSAYIHTFIIDKVNYPRIVITPPIVLVRCTNFDGQDCFNSTSVDTDNNSTEIVLGNIENNLYVTAVQQSFWIVFNKTDQNDDVTLFIQLTNTTSSTEITIYSLYRTLISPFEIRDTSAIKRVVYDVSYVPRIQRSDYSVQVTLGFGVFTTSSSSSYKLVNFAIDLGSTLSLYFGMTALTIFEIIVFFLYGRSHDILHLQPAPPMAVVYEIPAHIQFRRRDAARRLVIDKARQQRLAAMLPRIV